jgi:hypothetical protein
MVFFTNKTLNGIDAQTKWNSPLLVFFTNKTLNRIFALAGVLHQQDFEQD